MKAKASGTPEKFAATAEKLVTKLRKELGAPGSAMALASRAPKISPTAAEAKARRIEFSKASRYWKSSRPAM